MDRKRPLGLGASKPCKLAKTEDEPSKQENVCDAENTDPQTLFQLPEGDLSEEAELSVIFDGACAAFNDFKALTEEELEEEEGLPEDERTVNKCTKLLSGVVHECDRMLKMNDEDESTHKPVSEAVFEMMGEALFKIRCLQETEDLDGGDEYIQAALEKLDAGLEVYPENVSLAFSKASIQLAVALCQEECDAAQLVMLLAKLPQVTEETYQKNSKKIWEVVTEFSDLHDENPEVTNALTAACLKVVPSDCKSLSSEYRLQLASWRAKYIESLLEHEEVEMAEVETDLAQLKEDLLGEFPEDPETQQTFGEIISQYHLLTGSMHAMKEEPGREKECYQAAYKIFQDMEANLGTPVPEFILELIN